MPELRWALIGLGLAFFVGLVVFEWRRKGRAAPRANVPEAPVRSEKPRRIEPGLDAMPEMRGPGRETGLEVPVIHPMDPLPGRKAAPPLAEPVPVAAETAVDVPAAARGAGGEPVLAPEPEDIREPLAVAPLAPPAPSHLPAIRWPPAKMDRALSLRLVGRDGAPLAGRALRLALEAAGFVPGPQEIYHRVDVGGGVLVSAASMVQPGTLDPALMDGQQYRGVALFSVLPGPVPPAGMLDGLVEAARELARRLDGVVQDGKGAEFDAAAREAMRQSLGAPTP